MLNNKLIFTCTNCGAQYPKWQGRCLDCGKWGTLEQEIKKTIKQEINIAPDKPLNLSDLGDLEQVRLKTNIEELDRVLGGGIVSGSLILLGGDPGVGKSTLALEIAKNIDNLLYISGEESAQQIKIRADRLNLNLNNLKFLNQTNVEKIIATARETKPKLLIIDSVQTLNSDESASAPGSVSQITTSTSQLLALAKETNLAIIIIGHVTKDGLVAGPKTLEHLVDTVLYLENDNKNFYKILRSAKNRFGSTEEIGIFEMTGGGFKEIKNPTEIFFDQQALNLAGTAATIIMEGSRPFLVEIQALTAKTAFGYPIRKATGFDLNRLQMLLAVISKTSKLNLGSYDVYLNVAGGLKIKETAADLAVCLAIVSGFLDLAISGRTLILGEVGLSGEIRGVANFDKRLKEALKLNFQRIIVPAVKTELTNPAILMVKNLSEAVAMINKK